MPAMFCRNGNFLNLILECTGRKKKDKEAKVTIAQTLWVPPVNNHGEFGQWAFIKVRAPWDAKTEILTALNLKDV
jgi:type III restriction enzyme